MTQCTCTTSPGASRRGARSASTRAGTRDRDWVLGGGWSMGDFPGGLPTREELDAVVADRPVALTNRDYHGMWVNSKALEVAGITDSTPDPEGGRIERDASGRATGMLQEQAMHLVFQIAPDRRSPTASTASARRRPTTTASASPPGPTRWSTREIQAAYTAPGRRAAS